MAMDNMNIRKKHLEKLDQFVKTLYDETKVFSQYMNIKDLEILYLHIHDLIQEMLQCKTTDEFMAMIEELHKSIAGVLIVVAPSQASQVKQEMGETYEDFKAESFDDLINQIQKTATEKFGNKGKEKAEQMEKDLRELEIKERTQEDTDKILGALELDEDELRKQSRTNDKYDKAKKDFDKGFESKDSKQHPPNDPLNDLWT